MEKTTASREWVPAESVWFYEGQAAKYRTLPACDFAGEVARTLAAHERYTDLDCINLYAGTNFMNPRAARFQASSIGSRPSLGYPGDKYETGLGYAEQIEIMAVELIKRIFKCEYVEFRVGSGSLANLYAYMACTKPGDKIMALPDSAAGHVTHHAEGAAGLYGLEIHHIPFDGDRMEVDLVTLREQARQLRPKLIILGASLALQPYPVREVRQLADEIGAYLMFDAAHLSGIIAGGEFQQPLAEGAHLMTCSTYKSFGGPAGGLVLTNDGQVAEKLDRIAYPGLTANFDLARTAALVVAASDILEFGPAYARACIANARALAAALAGQGLPVHGPAHKGYTLSHHVAVRAAGFGGGTTASRRLEPANILTSGIGLPLPVLENDYNGLRIGTQEITRWGMQPGDMPGIAEFIARILVKGEDPVAVQPDVMGLRHHFKSLQFVFPE
jgi:glycine hydroxymethyltransferase